MLLIAEAKVLIDWAAAFFDAAAIALPSLLVLALLAAPMGFGWDAGAKIKEILPDPEDPDQAKLHQLKLFSPWMILLLNFVSGGLFTIIWLNMLHGKLPKLRRDDPSTGQALTKTLVPLYGLFGYTNSMGRLELRINEQRKLREMPFKPLSAGMFTVGICWLLSLFIVSGLLAHQMKWIAWPAPKLIMYLGAAPLIMNWIVFSPLACIIVQSSVNSICLHDAEEERKAYEKKLEEGAGEEQDEEQSSDEEQAEQGDEETESTEESDEPEQAAQLAEESTDQPVEEEETVDLSSGNEPEETIDLSAQEESEPEETIDLSELDSGGDASKNE